MKNTTKKYKNLLCGIVTAALFVITCGAMAQQKEITIAYQQINGPFLDVVASGAIEKATGYKVDWRKFDSGAKVAIALASGDVQIGVIGSSPLTAAVSRGVDVQLFWIQDDINQAEAMVARNGSGINTPADLKGKKIGVPFASTTHFHTMFALELWGIKSADVQLLNMQPNQIAAAWERGDIDAAYVWDPALTRIKQSGKVLVTSGELSKKGKATFDGMAVDRKWGEANADFMARFVKIAAAADAAYRSSPDSWTIDSKEVQANVKLTGAEPKNVAASVALYAYPDIQEQASSVWLGGGANGGVAKALLATAEFLKGEGKIDTLDKDYSRYVTSRYADAAMKLN
ncbi:taurine ABC transporter substrate-binding protein [Glaciimonas immobilis]|uniref:Taurine transport system substrate-binding protein n=1 Tax=Glaciimonas immobilis TaxID=728004 RepID=A0A840RMJ5_9BURK|nr:taurine ABC transporter substrate-binding protein [Glaciimonas immobilis]KAF3998908.1 taurine ABC transporter substrate-binding protein [Glaciimonas immobilis]MBB5198312.1 taurine transport system substrate-binding protein [Glaciimonas immobilis]